MGVVFTELHGEICNTSAANVVFAGCSRMHTCPRLLDLQHVCGGKATNRPTGLLAAGRVVFTGARGEVCNTSAAKVVFTGVRGCSLSMTSIKHVENRRFWHDAAKNHRNFYIFASGVGRRQISIKHKENHTKSPHRPSCCGESGFHECSRRDLQHVCGESGVHGRSRMLTCPRLPSQPGQPSPAKAKRAKM